MSGLCLGRAREGVDVDHPSLSVKGDGRGVRRDAVEAVYEDYYASLKK